MKKIMLTLIILLQLSSNYLIAQNNTTPTKQETADWLAGKMKQYLKQSSDDCTREFLKYENMNFYYSSVNVDGDKRTWCIHLDRVTKFIELKPVIYGSNDNTTQNNLYLMGISGINLFTNDFGGSVSDCLLGYYNINTVEQFFSNNQEIFWPNGVPRIIFRFDKEDNLTERAVKALRLLVKYNTQGTNEKF